MPTRRNDTSTERLALLAPSPVELIAALVPSRTRYAQRFDVPRHDELPRGVAVMPPVEGSGERRDNGQFAKGARTCQAAGGRATRNRRHAERPFGLPGFDEGERGDIARLARTFRRRHLREVARTVGGGQCPQVSVDLIGSASLLYAWSEWSFKEAERLGPGARRMELLDKARRFSDSYRVKLVTAYGFAADAAEGRARALAARATSSWLMLQPPREVFPSHLLRPLRLPEGGGRRPSVVVTAGADFGFRADSSALAIVGRDADGVVSVIEHAERRPRRGEPLQPAVVVSEFASLAKSHGARAISADLHYAESIREHLANAGLEFVATDTAPGAPMMRMVRLCALLERRQLRLDRRLCAELAKVQCRFDESGALSLVLPRRDGTHADLAVALAAAIDALPAFEIGPTP